jgi:hypothetical protein
LPQARWDAAAVPGGRRVRAVAAAELPEAVRRAAAVAKPFAAVAALVEVAGRRVAVQISEAPLSAAAMLHAALEPLTLRRVVAEARTLRPEQPAVETHAEARQLSGRFGVAFGLAAEFAASAELQRRVLVQPLARL